MARVDVPMPQMGESIAEGTVSRWIKKLGDEVKRDEPIFEISTDKVDAEVSAPNAGTIVEILVTEGQTVPVGALVARIETEKGAAAVIPEDGKTGRRAQGGRASAGRRERSLFVADAASSGPRSATSARCSVNRQRQFVRRAHSHEVVTAGSQNGGRAWR